MITALKFWIPLHFGRFAHAANAPHVNENNRCAWKLPLKTHHFVLVVALVQIKYAQLHVTCFIRV